MALSRMFNVYPLEDNEAEQLRELYTKCAAALSDGHTILKNYHFNSRGMGFIGFHRELDRLAESAESMISYKDTCGELVAQMGYQAELTPEDIQEVSPLSNIEFKDVGSVQEACTEISKMYKIIIDTLVNTFKESDKLGDVGGSNAIQDIVQKLNYDAWNIAAWLRTAK